MSGTKQGGIKARNTIFERHGKDWYKKIGAIGGSVITDKPKGFANNPALARIAGKKGGKISKRGKAIK